MTLAFIVCASALNVNRWMTEEANLKQVARYGNAVITIGLNSDSQTRFLRTEDVYETLSDNVVAAGGYDLPIYTDDGAFFSTVAVDFTEITQIFDFQFIEYGEVKGNSVDDTAFVTQAFAEKNSLGIGDSFSCNLLGNEKTYTVQGITARAFMDRYEVMVSVSGVMRLLARSSPVLAVLGDGIQLYSSLYIAPKTASEGGHVQEWIAALRAEEMFADKTITNTEDSIRQTQSDSQVFVITIYMSIGLVIFLSAAVVFCCFYILSQQRANENALFHALGVKSSSLLFL
ncbi:MAG: hypothetical protein J6Z36_00060, partial [Clostridia bacterium]|nr:hypothetical protein [Clostridia bacterium]